MYHLDGLRVDGVASMLYLDYSREAGQWEPNVFGGNENLEAIHFLKEFNQAVYSKFPQTLTIAEESTAWNKVSKPVYEGGLGFGMKWMMGWMHDALSYFTRDCIHRKYHQHELTFSMHYYYHENFVLPLSHDEVVHGKGSLIENMPGDLWQKFANLRVLYAYMFLHPGHPMLFMGSEFAQFDEWNHDKSLDWHLLDFEHHRGILSLVKELNRLLKAEPAMYVNNYNTSGFEWIDYSDSESSVFAFLRKSNDPSENLYVFINGTPEVRHYYGLGVESAGDYEEIFNSDLRNYGGSHLLNGTISTQEVSCHGRPCSISITLPPLALIVFKKIKNDAQ